MRRLWNVLHEDRLRPLIGFALVVAALGFIGYLVAGVSVLEAVYGTISLFTVNYISPADAGGDAHVPLILQFARFTAPLVTAGTALTAAAAILRDELDLVRARRMKEHVIVCGAGDHGNAIAVAFHDRGHRVVVVESDPASAELSPLRHRRIPVVIGDATDPSQMRLAGTGRAGRIIIALDDDDTSAECLATLQTIPVEGDVQHIHCHVTNPSLDAYFTSRTADPAATDEAAGKRRIEWFNTERLAGNILLNEHFRTARRARSVAGEIDAAGAAEVSDGGIAIVGASEMAHTLLLEAARSWDELGRSAGNISRRGSELHQLWPKLPVTVIDENAAAWVEGIRAVAPELDRAVEVELVEASPFGSGWDPSIVDVAYVTAEDPVEALELAHYLSAVKSGRARIVVRAFAGSADLAAALEGADRDDAIHMVNVIERTCTVEMITRELVQLLAMEDHLLRQPETGDGSSPEPWYHLSPEVKEEHLQAATHHLEVKLPGLGAELISTLEPNLRTEVLLLTDEEVETLALMEHDRRGGSMGQLRRTAREIPMMFSASGYRVVRPDTGTSESSG